ncbi:MAG: trimethylamine corrinoid protein 2 [Firmicutes bacterium]|nr:trimethylamine corrinoid protein 2 [Bacillota bacterium]
MKYKSDWNQVKERLRALWEGELIDRCCISVTAPKDKSVEIDPFAGCESDEPEILRKFWEDPEIILERNLKRIENTFFGGEALPQIFLNFGTAGHAIYFGADYKYTPDSVWYSPVINDWQEDPLVFDEDNEFYQRQLKIAEYLVNESGDRFFVSMSDNCGTLDALAHLRGSENILMDMVLHKEELKKAVKVVNRGWAKANEEFFQIIKESAEGGSTHGWMNTWAPGRQMQMQCDLSVMISPEQYKEFVIPELEEQMEWIDYPIYHFDGKEQINHLDYILGLEKLKMIQWTDVDGQEPPVSFIPILKRIQDAGKGLILFTPINDVPKLLTELSARGLYINTRADSVEEAREAVKYVAEHSRE